MQIRQSGVIKDCGVVVDGQAGLRQSDLRVGVVQFRDPKARIQAPENSLGDGVGVDDVSARLETIEVVAIELAEIPIQGLRWRNDADCAFANEAIAIADRQTTKSARLRMVPPGSRKNLS